MRKIALAAALLVSLGSAYPAGADQPHYSTAHTPIGTLMADSGARAVIAQLFPELVASKAVAAGYANRMTLRMLKRFRPKSFTDSRLAAADAEFAKLRAQ